MPRTTLPLGLLIAFTAGLALAVTAWSPSVAAKPPAVQEAKEAKADGKKPAAPAAKGGPPPGVTANACGCYRTEAGACVCGDKKGKCECPGDCEPIGCDAKRTKEAEREIAAETKRAQEEEKKRQAAEAAAEAARNTPIPEEGAEDAEPPKGEKNEKSEARKAPRKPAKETPVKNK